MTTTALRVLVIGPRQPHTEQIVHELRHAGFNPDMQFVETEDTYLHCPETGFDIILAARSPTEFGALNAVDHLRASGTGILAIVANDAHDGEDKAEGPRLMARQ